MVTWLRFTDYLADTVGMAKKKDKKSVKKVDTRVKRIEAMNRICAREAAKISLLRDEKFANASIEKIALALSQREEDAFTALMEESVPGWATRRES